MTTTILLADDHVLFRQGLAALLGQQADWRIVGEAGDGEEVVRLAEGLKPNIAVLDVEMPGMSGIDAADGIRLVSPRTRIVALSMYGDAHYQRRMFQAGASAYVLKNEAIDELVDAVNACLRGEKFASPSAVRELDAAEPVRSAEVGMRALSDRESAVLRLLAEGRRTKEIASILGISAKTVETYRGRIILKPVIYNVPGLVKFAVRAGLTSAGT